MGKGLEKKQQEQFEYLENARLRAATNRIQLELFDKIQPETNRRLEVLAPETPPDGVETLCARYSADGEIVEFTHGEQPVAFMGRMEFDAL